MHDHDRERLGLSITLAVLLHAVVAAVFWLVGWAQFEPYPEYTPPLYVDLESSFVPEEVTEPESEPEEDEELLQAEEGPTVEAEPEQDAEPPDQSPPDELPAEPPAAEQPAAEQSAAEQPAPEVEQPAPPPEQAPQPAEPEAEPEPQQTYDFGEDIATLYGREEPEDAPERPADDGFLVFSEEDTAADPTPVPDWVNEVMNDSGISTEGMESEEITQLATKIDRDPELEALMRQANAAVERGRVPQRDESATASPASDSTEPSTERLSDNAAIQWSGESGGRGTGGDLPVISESDFTGPIPPRITFVVVFDVDARGLVVPGTVVLQRKSGSTQVDRKVRSAVLDWKFLPKPGADVETGVFTLVVERRDIR